MPYSVQDCGTIYSIWADHRIVSHTPIHGPKGDNSGSKIERLRSILEERDDWTTEEVQDLIEKRFGIRFTQKHVRTILRKLGMKYAKPYQHDYRRPKNAEDDLKKT